MGSHLLHNSHSLIDEHCNIINPKEMCVTHKQQAESLAEGMGMVHNITEKTSNTKPLDQTKEHCTGGRQSTKPRALTADSRPSLRHWRPTIDQA